MQLLMLLAGSLLVGACISIAWSVRALLSEKKLRAQWVLWMAITGFVGAGIFVTPMVSNRVAVTGEIPVLQLLVGGLLLVQLLLVLRTILFVKNVQSVKGVSIIDPLTGAYNRFYLEQRLNTEVCRCHRYNTPLAVMAVEINSFKAFNDEYGHHGGDIALQRLSDCLCGLVRTTDVVARYKAGCFILMLPDTPEGNTTALLARLRAAVNDIVVIEGAGVEKSIRIKASFGVAHCVLANRNGIELIDTVIGKISSNKITGQQPALKAAMSSANS